MIIYNLTNFSVRGESKSGMRIKVRGVPIEPGKSAKFSDDFPIYEISGLLRSNALAVDKVPGWYQRAMRKAVDAAASKSTPKQKPKKKSE